MGIPEDSGMTRGLQILPESASEFRSVAFWNRFFERRGLDAFEWYGDLADVASQMHGVLTTLASRLGKASVAELRILIIGNGTSSYPFDLARMFRIHDITSVDFSAVAIAEMKRRSAAFPMLKWIVADVRELSSHFPAETFDAVIDKGFLDAYLARDSTVASGTNGSFNADAELDLHLSQIRGVLTTSGVHLVTSLLQPYIATALTRSILAMSLRHPTKLTIESIRVVPFTVRSLRQSLLQPYLVAMWYSLTAAGDEHPPAVAALPAHQGARVPMCQLFPDTDTDLSAPQQFPLAGLPKRINALSNERGLRAATQHVKPGCSREVSLVDQATSQVRYHIDIWDNTGSGRKPTQETAAIMIPTGRENDWLYTSHEGQQQLAQSASAQRLLLVRGAGALKLQNAKEIINEISPYLKSLAISAEATIPVLMVADQVGERVEVAAVASSLAGTIFVHDYRCEGSDWNRRVMSFSANPRILQSEIAVTSDGCVKPGAKVYCNYYEAILAAFALLPGDVKSAPQWKVRTAVLGVGGGVLVRLLTELAAPVFGELIVEGIELDPQVLEVARTFFGYPATDDFREFGPKSQVRVLTVLGDAFEHVQQMECDSHDVLIVDINDYDSASAIVCPPEPFFSKELIHSAYTALKPGGLLIFNLVTRSDAARKRALKFLKTHFSQRFEFHVEGDINRVIACRKPGFKGTPCRRAQFLENLQILADARGAHSWVPEVENCEWEARLTILE